MALLFLLATACPTAAKNSSHRTETLPASPASVAPPLPPLRPGKNRKTRATLAGIARSLVRSIFAHRPASNFVAHGTPRDVRHRARPAPRLLAGWYPLPPQLSAVPFVAEIPSALL